MALCALCQTIDFSNIYKYPESSKSYYCLSYTTTEILVFKFPNDQKARAAGIEGTEEFSQTYGTPHHQSIDELKSAAKDCTICSIIEKGVDRSLAALKEAGKNKLYVHYRKNEKVPDWRMWLARRWDGGDGFMVMSYTVDNRAWLIAAVGFCVLENDPLNSLIAGRVIQASADSEILLDRAIGWIHECDSQHSALRCSIAQRDAELPRRVLDLEYDQAPSRIRLYETSQETGRYTVLSHCWGTNAHLTTTRATIATHKEGISFDGLPKTFRDAVILTRKLGIRYIWIDSLCICQDDGPDWERESAKMASIYASAYLSIAAVGSSENSGGFFLKRSPPEYIPFSYTDRTGVTGTIQAFDISKEEVTRDFFFVLDQEPLSTRGWALQERFLAPRSLHSGQKQFYFECYGHCKSESGIYTKGRPERIHEDVSLDTTQGDHKSELQSGRKPYRAPQLWYNLLYSYCPRKLTKSSDKLPALSGLARTFEESTGDKYLAGLWRSQLIEGMIWQAIGVNNGGTGLPSSYRAPSWSWASIDGRVGNLGLGTTFQGDAEWADVATVLDAHVELKGENPYGEVTSGYIVINAPLEPLTRSDEKEPDWETVPHDRAPRLKTRSGRPFGAYAMFDIKYSEEALSKMRLNALVLAWRPDVEDGVESRVYQAIIVTPVEGRDACYQRKGKIIFSSESLGQCDWMEDEAKKQTITFI